MSATLLEISIRRFAALASLTPAEANAIRGLCERTLAIAAREVIRDEGATPPLLYFLLDGWAMTSIGLSDGGRQILKAHLPGDVMGAPSAPFAEAVETITAVTACTVAPFTREALAQTFQAQPRLGWLFFLAAQQERAALMDRLTAAGQLGAHRNLALLLLQLHARLDRASGDDVEIPLTQQQIGDMLGLTPVHVNRVVRDLDREGLIRRAGRRYELVDLARLRAFVGLPARTLAPPVQAAADDSPAPTTLRAR